MLAKRPGRLMPIARRLAWIFLLMTTVILVSADPDPLTALVALTAFAVGCASRPRIDRALRRPAAPAAEPEPCATPGPGHEPG